MRFQDSVQFSISSGLNAVLKMLWNHHGRDANRKELTVSRRRNMLSKSALADVAGPLNDFTKKLGGSEGNEWLDAFKRFLRKEDAWQSVVGTERDMRKEHGWELVENVEEPLVETDDLELARFDGEIWSRVPYGSLREYALNSRASLGQEHAEYLLKHQDEIPEEWRKVGDVAFPAQIWLDTEYHTLYFPYIYWNGEVWKLDFSYLTKGGDDEVTHFARYRE